MNPHKLRAILDFVRSQGALPTARFGKILEARDLLVWFGLGEALCAEERMHVATELAQIREAQAFVDRLLLKRV